MKYYYYYMNKKESYLVYCFKYRNLGTPTFYFLTSDPEGLMFNLFIKLEKKVLTKGELSENK